MLYVLYILGNTQDLKSTTDIAAQESTNHRVGGSVPGYSFPRVDVSLGKTRNPKLLPKGRPVPSMPAPPPSV